MEKPTVKVEVIKEFRDRENNLSFRKVGDTYDTTQERSKYLSILGYVKVLNDVPKKTKKTEDK